MNKKSLIKKAKPAVEQLNFFKRISLNPTNQLQLTALGTSKFKQQSQYNSILLCCFSKLHSLNACENANRMVIQLKRNRMMVFESRGADVKHDNFTTSLF
jgi:hypothetical protein